MDIVFSPWLKAEVSFSDHLLSVCKLFTVLSSYLERL